MRGAGGGEWETHSLGLHWRGSDIIVGSCPWDDYFYRYSETCIK